MNELRISYLAHGRVWRQYLSSIQTNLSEWWSNHSRTCVTCLVLIVGAVINLAGGYWWARTTCSVDEPDYMDCLLVTTMLGSFLITIGLVVIIVGLSAVIT